jgi:hypothetical protein
MAELKEMIESSEFGGLKKLGNELNRCFFEFLQVNYLNFLTIDFQDTLFAKFLESA